MNIRLVRGELFLEGERRGGWKDGWRDRHDEADNQFSLFFGRVETWILCIRRNLGKKM